MEQQTWTMLALSMALLSESELPFASSTVPLAEQFLYLACGEEALSGLDHEQETPPPEDAGIPQELWEVLQKIPLSLDYFQLVEQTLQTHPQFWEQVVDTSVEGSGVKNFSDFPWRADNSLEFDLGLDDYVMLKCLNETSWLTKLSSVMEDLVEPISVPLLSEVLQTGPAEPVLLVYDESCPRSQALMYALEDETVAIFKVTAL